MSLLDKFSDIEETRRGLGDADPTAVVIDHLESPTRAMINGQSTVLAGTNNYLGLTFDAAGIEAGTRALQQEGTGTTGSRMANGTYRGHIALETEIAGFYGYNQAIIFSTGYAANLGTLMALLDTGDAVLLDADAHASLFDGSRMSPADVFTFKHNDPDSLDKRLTRLKDQASKCLVVIEGLYSILGDTARLKELVEVKDKHGALLLIDEAHSLGVFGEKGRGLVEVYDMFDKVDFVVGTFSKSLGTTGGFCTSRHSQLSLFPYASRPYMFTASPSPAVVECTRAALRSLRERPELQQALWRNAERLHQGLLQIGVNPGNDASPVMSVRLGKREDALSAWKHLLDNGVYVNLILPPAAPGGGSLLRMSVSAAHQEDEIDAIVAGLRNALASLDS